jgi:hypothetical protein
MPENRDLQRVQQRKENMSTKALSKIKTARVPTKCHYCKARIEKGIEYFCYQTGQRSSVPICMACIRTPQREHSYAHELYRERYGLFSERKA